MNPQVSVLFVKGKGLLPLVIRVANARSFIPPRLAEFAHCAIRVRTHQDYVFEMNPGFLIWRADDYIKEYNPVEAVDGLPSIDPQEAYDYLMSCKNVKYDWRLLALWPLRHRFSWANSRADFICSELVLNTFKNAGYDLYGDRIPSPDTWYLDWKQGRWQPNGQKR